MEPSRDTLRKAIAAVQHVGTPEQALVHVRECADELPEVARRFALDAGAALLSLGDGVHRRMLPRIAVALALCEKDAARALEDNVVFLRPSERGPTPYRG